MVFLVVHDGFAKRLVSQHGAVVLSVRKPAETLDDRLARESVLPPSSVAMTDIIEVEAMADAQPNVRHLQARMRPVSFSTSIHTAIMSPHACLPTTPLPSASYVT